MLVTQQVHCSLRRGGGVGDTSDAAGAHGAELPARDTGDRRPHVVCMWGEAPQPGLLLNKTPGATTVSAGSRPDAAAEGSF